MLSIDVDLIDSSIVIPLDGVSAKEFQVLSRGVPVTRLVRANITTKLQMALCGLDVVKSFGEQDECLANLGDLELRAGDESYPLNIKSQQENIHIKSITKGKHQLTINAEF